MNKFDHLPFEVILLILDHVDKLDLYACSLINKRLFKDVMPLLWRRVDIHSEDALIKITTAMAESSHSPGVHVRSVAMKPMLSDTALLAFIQHVPLVEHLQLDNAQQLTDTSFQHVSAQCPHLITLDLTASPITLLSMEALAQHCHQLGVIRLKFCSRLDYTKLFSVLRRQGCPLKEIDLTPCYLDDHITSEQVAAAIALDVAGFPDLMDLRLNGMFNDCTAFITTANAHGIVWPRLTHFVITSCVDVDDAMAIAFLQAHPRLEYLEWGCSNITDQTLDAMATCLPVIRDIRVHGNTRLSASGIYRLVKNCSTLVNGIHCARCNIFTKDGDFPSNLDSRSYTVRGPTNDEVTWFAAMSSTTTTT